MKALRANIQTVFVVKHYNTEGIFEDEVLKQGDRRFKSIKFRHTYYTAADFFYTYREALVFVHSQKFSKGERKDSDVSQQPIFIDKF